MRHQSRALLFALAWGIGMAMIPSLGRVAGSVPAARSFAEDLAFLRQYTKVIALSDETGEAQILLAPAWQGRVLTSTATGEAGPSYGWINRDLIASGTFVPHMNPLGGEDRLWVGPEGGQFSVFFAKGATFDLEHWFTPAPIDTEPFEVAKAGREAAEFRHAFTLTNYSGTALHVRAGQTVRLMPPAEAWKALGAHPAAGVRMVAFESVNTITNTGKAAWTTSTGLLSIWILGQFNPSPATTIVVPIRPGPEAELGRRVNADYFGAVPPDRLVVRDRVLFFSGDGASRVLTLVQFSMPPAPHGYVNSMWEIQKEPFAGDVANSYNDGPPAPGAKPLGPFYELESSSPAAALAPGASFEHVHRTIHLTGPEAAIDAVARAALGVGLDEITRALPGT
jgi:hypothetical protein